MTVGIEAGVLLVDKPVGKTSFAMVRAVRRLLKIKKVGHAGTLDPFASGLLVVCIGRPATKLVSALMEGEKEYLATLQLGAVSTTQDPEGEISATSAFAGVSGKTVEQVFARFRGMIRQTPPSFSALKYKGKPLYHYARRGISIQKESREVYISHLEWLDRRAFIDTREPSLSIKVRCSKGTYIRALASDIGDAIGCGAYLSALRRTRSGFFSVQGSVPGTYLDKTGVNDLLYKSILSVENVQNLLQ